MAPRGESIRLRVGLVLAAAVFAGMAWPMVYGKVDVRDDLAYGFVPGRWFFAECLARGESWSWFPQLFCGFFALGEGGGMTHPWVRFLYGTLPLGPALNVERLASYPALLAGFLVLAGRWGVRRDAAVFGAILYAFGGYNLLHSMHMTVMPILAQLPWLLVAIDVAMRTDDPRRLALARIAVGLLTASQLLFGQVQFVWISGVCEACYALFLAGRVPGSAWRLGGLAAAKGLGVLGASAQLWPLWEALRASKRERPSSTFVAMGSLPPLNLIQWVAPYLSVSRVVTPPMPIDGGVLDPAPSMWDWRVHEFAMYYGAAVPALLIGLVLHRRQLGGLRRLAIFAALLAVGSFVLALGEYTPLFALTTRVPVVGRFRLPVRYLALTHLAIALLAAVAFAVLGDAAGGAESRPRLPWRRLWPLGLPTLASLAVCLAPRLPEGLWPAYLRGAFVAGTPWLIAGPVLVASGSALVAGAARGSRAALLGLVVFAAADQAFYGFQLMTMTPPQTVAEYVAARPSPPGDASVRVKFDGLRDTWHNAYMMKGLRTVSGYVALVPRKRLLYDKPSSLRVAGVGWVMPTADERGQPWKPVPGPLPRVRLVTRAEPTTDANRDIDRIDVATTALVSRALRLPGGAAGAARLVGDRPGKLDVMTEAGSRQLLVVSESHHRGWRVKIDGHTQPVVRVYGDFLGCVVPPGQHHVQFRFRPTSQVVGPWLSALGLVLITIVPLAPFCRQVRAPRPGSGLAGMPTPHVLRHRTRRAPAPETAEPAVEPSTDA